MVAFGVIADIENGQLWANANAGLALLPAFA